jgi:hypothetical protein
MDEQAPNRAVLNILSPKIGATSVVVATALPVVFLSTSGHYIEAAIGGAVAVIALASRIRHDRSIASALDDDRRRIAVVEIPPEIRQMELVAERRAALQIASDRFEANFYYDAAQDGDVLRARVHCKVCGWEAAPRYARRFDALSHLDEAHASPQPRSQPRFSLSRLAR